MSFCDHFGSVSQHYAQSRPSYPPALFAWLASQCETRTLAWDCATGSGQAAVGLAEHFDQIIATDASAAQIAAASAHARITYQVTSAEACALADHSVDLVTVAQALHWFDVDAFYREVRRVTKAHGALAVWTYGNIEVDGGEGAMAAVLRHFYTEVVGPYWPPQRRHVENGYRDLPFPFRVQPTPIFEVRLQWTLAHLLAYLRSWSASAAYAQARGHDAVDACAAAFSTAWGEQPVREVRWPLLLRFGRMC